MKYIKRFILILLLLLFISPLFAEEEWFVNKPISAITFSGYQNVKESTLNELVSKYVGAYFTYEVFDDLNATLYSQSFLDYLVAEAESGDKDGNEVILKIEIHENPLIKDVVFNGNKRLKKDELKGVQNLSKGGYYVLSSSYTNNLLLKEHYISKGYKDAQVRTDPVINEEDNTVVINYNIEEGKQYKVKSILFEGVENIKVSELKKVLTQKEKSFFNNGNYIESNITTDKSALLSLYNSKGYPDSEIKETRIEEIKEDENDNTIFLKITYAFNEGEVWKIGKITFSGNEKYSNDEIQELITVNEGDLYNLTKIQGVYENIALLYYNHGYVSCSVVPLFNRNEVEHTLDISFQINEGDQATIEEIRINGLKKTKPFVLERELEVKVGDVFSRDAFIQSQQNMYNTSLLKDIKGNIYQGTTNKDVICEFEVEEGNTMELQFGATFGATEVNGFPISAFLTLSNTNFLGYGHTLSVSANLSPTTQSLSAGYTLPWFKNVRWANSFSFSFERNVRSGILQRGVGSDAFDGRDKDRKTYPLGYDSADMYYNVLNGAMPNEAYLMNYDYYSLSLGWNTGYSFVFKPGKLSLSAGLSFGLNKASYDSDKYLPYESLIEKYNESFQFSNRLSMSITWDGRNYVSSNPYGYVSSLSLVYAGGLLGGLSNYNKLAFSLSGYVGLFPYGGGENKKSMHAILGGKSEISVMLPQFWNYNNSGWALQDPKTGATRYEMLYIDGMNTGKGFSVIPDQALLWNNEINLNFPIVEDVISIDAFVSGTAIKSNLDDDKERGFGSLNWYFAAGAGIKMEIPGFPLALYLVKNATVLSGNGWKWVDGNLFHSGNDLNGSGLSLVLAISTSIF